MLVGFPGLVLGFGVSPGCLGFHLWTSRRGVSWFVVLNDGAAPRGGVVVVNDRGGFGARWKTLKMGDR